MEKYITGIKAAVAAVVAMMIERDGLRYSEAIDPLDSGRVYTETDEPIDIGTGETIVQEWDALEAPLTDPTPEEIAEFKRQQAAKKLLRNPAIRAMFERYRVETGKNKQK